MIRTRDFMIVLMIILLLVIGITISVIRDDGRVDVDVVRADQLLGSAILIDEYQVAELTNTTSTTSSEERLASMRERVLAYRSDTTLDQERFVVREEAPEPTMAVSESEEPADAVAVASVQECATHQSFSGFWPTGVSVEEHEGARLVINRNQTETSEDAAGEESFLSGEILAQLPLPQQPSGAPTCVAMDVVGIALDGSLIRNTDHTAYGFFGSETVVGYALDGFPIYGQDDAISTDQCGGSFGHAGYGYVLQSDRPSILNCFSGRPTTI